MNLLNEWWWKKMVINKISYKTYGRILDREIQLKKGLNIFIGDNESGKTTIFNSIYSTLFGFNPTNRDKHPYTNWDKKEIVFSTEINHLEELFLVERSLKSVPKLNLVQMSNGHVQTFRNEALPFIHHVSEGMFEKVFYLSAEDLNSVEKETWENVQEKLIFNYGSDYLRKTSDVLTSLEQEINSLWRRDKRGNPLINQLQTELGQLKIQKIRAEENYDLMHKEIDRLDQYKSEQISNEDLKRKREAELKNLRKILPVKELMEKIESLNKKVFKKDEFEGFSTSLLSDMKSKEENFIALKNKCDQIIESILELKSQLIPMSAHDEKLFEISSELDTLKFQQNELMRFEHEEHSKLEELIRMGEKIDAQYRLLFGKGMEDKVKENLKKIQVLDLISLLQKYSEGIETNRINEMQSKYEAINHKKYNFVLMSLGIVLTLLGFVLKPVQQVTLLGVGILGYSLAKLMPSKKRARVNFVDLDRIEEQIDIATHGIKLPEYVFREDSQRFLSKLEQLITLLFDEEVLNEKWDQILVQKHELEAKLEELFKRANLDTSRGVRLTLQYALLQIDTLIQSNELENAKKMKIAHLEDNLLQVKSEYSVNEEELNSIYETIKRFGEGNLQFGKDQLMKNLELQNSIKVFKEELSNYQFDLEQLVNFDVMDIDKLEDEIRVLQVRDKELTEAIVQLTSTIEIMKCKFDLDRIESDILACEENLHEVIRRRDELMVTFEILKWSDEKFRVKNQPDIIHRVSHFMSVMTAQKYTQVLIKEENNQYELQFLVNGELMSAKRAFSKGTIQQLYFAYRLAVIEALDPENQMPLVLDEALINWDQSRFDETLKILDEISKDRQILFFTCHKGIALRMINQLNANLIEVNS